MHVNERVSVTYAAVDDLGRQTTKTATGRCVFVHPDGRFATVRLPVGYCVTIYPPRRIGSYYINLGSQVRRSGVRLPSKK